MNVIVEFLLRFSVLQQQQRNKNKPMINDRTTQHVLVLCATQSVQAFIIEYDKILNTVLYDTDIYTRKSHKQKCTCFAYEVKQPCLHHNRAWEISILNIWYRGLVFYLYVN